MNLFLTHAWASSLPRLMAAVGVTLGFAVLARALRGVTRSGMLAGAFCCFLLFSGAGPSALAALIVLFVITWATTRVGRGRKQDLGVAERHDGRNATQVLANLAVAVLAAVGFAWTGNRIWFAAMTAALAEAATDTVASEVGQSFSRATAVLITTWKPVPAGTDGGITMVGTAAGLIAGMIVGVAALSARLSLAEFWILVGAGFIGMLADSLLGATLQRRGWLSNEAVNLIGTLTGATIAYGVISLL